MEIHVTGDDDDEFLSRQIRVMGMSLMDTMKIKSHNAPIKMSLRTYKQFQ